MRSIYFLTALSTGFAFASGFYAGRMQTSSELLDVMVKNAVCSFAGDNVDPAHAKWKWALERFEER